MVVPSTFLAAWTAHGRQGMSIIEAGQPFTLDAVIKHKCITQTMGSFRRRRNAPDLELHPVARFVIDSQLQAVKLEQMIKAGIAIDISHLLPYH